MIKNETPIGVIADKYGMTIRTQNILKSCDISTFGEFMLFVPSMTIRNMGKRSFQEIINLQDLLNSELESEQVELTKEIDWEEVRIKAAIGVLNAEISANWFSYIKDDESQAKELSANAVLIADALIAELKEGGDQ